jgi:hypothetical protein
MRLHRGEPAAQLRARIAGACHLQLLPEPGAVAREAAQIFGDQFILGGEVPVERHLIGAGGLGDCLDPHGADSMPVEQVGRRCDDPVARRQLCFFVSGRRDFGVHGIFGLTGVLPVSIHHICYRSVPHQIPKVTPLRWSRKGI